MSCNFCGYDQQEGRFCDECGMANPAFARLPAHRLDPGAAPKAEEVSSVLCRQCGVMTRAVRCPGCGVPVSRDG